MRIMMTLAATGSILMSAMQAYVGVERVEPPSTLAGATRALVALPGREL